VDTSVSTLLIRIETGSEPVHIRALQIQFGEALNHNSQSQPTRVSIAGIPIAWTLRVNRNPSHFVRTTVCAMVKLKDF
jgi:hypothetical protein